MQLYDLMKKVGPGSYIVQKYDGVKGSKDMTSKYANLK